MTEKQRAEINQLNSEITNYHNVIWILIEKFTELDKRLNQEKKWIVNLKKENEILYENVKKIRIQYVKTNDPELSKKLGKKLKVTGQRHTVKSIKITEKEKKVSILKQDLQTLEKEINNIAKILDQKLDNIPIIFNPNLKTFKILRDVFQMWI